MKANRPMGAASVTTAIVVVLVSACSTSFPGEGGTAGTSGTAGVGGTGGPMFSYLEALCRDWCRNEALTTCVSRAQHRWWDAWLCPRAAKLRKASVSASTTMTIPRVRCAGTRT